jgi:(S)-ureidoglycine aminohydrolase
VYVIDGEIGLDTADDSRHLTTGGYAYLPPKFLYALHSPATSRLLVIERHYTPPAIKQRLPLPAIFAQEQDVEDKPFLGDLDARLKTLLPEDPAFDMAVNIFIYQPGAALPFVEVHVMEHGLLMLDGAGIYRLSESWYPVQAGDAIWMAPYCPQWFVAMGKTPARYIYYKDVNRDTLGDAP